MILVTLTKQKCRTPWRWCRCIETCNSAYVISNTVDAYIYIQGVPGGMCQTLGECSL